MAAITMSVEEYLRTGFEPDAEYVDGVIEERNVGETRHSRWQVALIIYIGNRAEEWGVLVRSELRTQTGERRYRVPDVAVLDAALEEGSFAVHPLWLFLRFSARKTDSHAC